MNERDRLREIIETLPPQQVQALLTLLAPHQSISHDEFTRLLAAAPEEDVDEETTARILGSEVEPGESISHDEMKRRLGVAAESCL
jgi:hypothetical protein